MNQRTLYRNFPIVKMIPNLVRDGVAALSALIGLPKRFSLTRHKIAEHPETGVSDRCFMETK